MKLKMALTMKNKYKGLLLLIFSLTMILQPIQVVQATSDSIAQANAGSINGIYWAYNQNKERVRSSSITVTDSATVDKSVTNSKTIQTNMQLITGFQNIDFYYDRYVKFVMRDGANSTYKQEKGLGLKGSVGNTTGNVDNILTAAFNAFYRYDWATKYIFTFNKSQLLGQAILGLAGGLKLWTGNIYVGNSLTSAWFTTNVSVSIIQYRTVPMIDIFQQKYGEMSVPELNITYLFDQNQTPGNLADDQVTLIEHIVPEYQLISVKTQSFPVTVQQSTLTSASLTGSYNFTGQYSETNIGDEVLISDGNNFVFGWYGLESTTINYNQSGGFTIQGALTWTVTNDISFSNGTKVSENIRMPWWRSSNMSFNGLWSHAFSSQGSIFGKGALQTIIEAIRTRASTSAQDQLLIWANIIPSTMFGYSDTDNSGDASVRLNGSSLEILDTVMAVGLAQGVNIQQTYHYDNHVNAHSFWQLGTNVLSDKAVDSTGSGVSILNESWGANPNSSEFSSTSVDFSWTSPVESNGKVTFKWGIAYNKFPVTWAITDGTTEILNHVELMNLGYDYTLTVDPTNGEAVLSNTYENSGFQNATVKAMANQLSFATYKRDLFLGMQKSSDKADSTEAVNQGNLTTTFGNTEVIDQAFGGTKQQYSLADGSKYDSQTTIVNVITGTGTSGEPESVNVSTYSPFASSWFGRNVGLSLLKWSADNRTQNSGVNWQFRENLVITAYPTWKGQGIVHDPTYSAVYTPREGQNPSSNPSSTSSAPWDLSFSIMALFMVISIVHLKRKNNRKF